MQKLKIGLVSFTDPRAVKDIETIDAMNRKCQNRLAAHLRKAGFEVVLPLKTRLVRSRKLAAEAAQKLLAEDVHALVLGCWKWTDPMLAVDVVRRVNRPVCLAGEAAEDSTALGCMSAVGAALWEIAPNEHAARHARIIGDSAAIADWARGAAAASWLKQQVLLLWGGSYCLKMAHLDDDASRLKALFIGDILVEDQYHLIQGAEAMLKSDKKRVQAMVQWLKKGGASIVWDKPMLTPAVLNRQIALYLAARDRLAQLEGEGVSGVSIKCQPALSEAWGVTGCMLPAFLPFERDSEGQRQAVPTTCEGDIKGLITSLLLERLAGVPAGFGDIRNMEIQGRQCLIVSNCGAASAYYAALSGDPKKALPALRFRGQCQGASGAAIGYSTPAFGKATIARLIRKQGRYIMQYAAAESLDASPDVMARLGWGDVWPVSVFDINMDLGTFTASVGSNHYSFVPGDFIHELKSWCRCANVDMECLNR